MRSGKSTNLLMVAHNYKEQNKNVLLLTSALDNRYGVGKITSRIGIDKEAIAVSQSTSTYSAAKTYKEGLEEYDKALHCILIDEAQFLTREQVIELAKFVDDYNVPVIAYGLKNDFSNSLFEGSQALLTFADKIEEVKTTCTLCNRKAIMNIRIDSEGNPIYTGEQIQIGDETYQPVCRKHYYNFNK